MAIGVALLATTPAAADTVVSPGEPVTSTGSLGNWAAPGGTVTRQQVINRAQDWVDQKVPYSANGLSSPYGWWADDATGGRYREDCSGFISMAWQLTSSLTTDSLPGVSAGITKSELQPGDALNDISDGHVVLFAGWTDQSAGTFKYYAEHRRGVPTSLEQANVYSGSIDGHPAANYQSLRYKKISGSATSVMRVDTVSGGNVFDNQRNPDGSWDGAALLDGSGAVTQVATAALADGTFHVQTLAGGKVFDNQRNRDGSWTGAALLDGSGSVTAIASTALPDGTMHVQTVADGKVFDNQRNTNGSWTGAALLDGNGSITAVSAAGLADGTMHVQTLASGKVFDNQRNPDGSWNGAALLDGNGNITAVSAAGLADGTMHVQTLASGKVFDNQRNRDGSWNGAALLDGNGSITAVSAAGLADGTMHVQTLASGKVFDNQRNRDGSWNGAALLDGNGNITAVSAAGSVA
ncbi:hypothetical protein [Kitasatospora sp. NPDC097691]|uniref:hypothetical protein n=1 Tax=Kitasatospora sp. NPDC097691 TaxID=3157231 RepID=UPI0033201EBD